MYNRHNLDYFATTGQLPQVICHHRLMFGRAQAVLQVLYHFMQECIEVLVEGVVDLVFRVLQGREWNGQQFVSQGQRAFF